MNDSLFSASWYRVAHIKPLLRSHAEIHRHTYRGKDWYVMQDHATGRFHRFSVEAYLVMGLMDGRRTLQEIWDAACERLGDDMPTQDEIISLLSMLHSADVLQSDILPDIEDVDKRMRRRKRDKILFFLKSPLSMKFPLFDPDRFLEQTLWLVRPLMSRAAAIFWVLLMIAGAALAGIHWKELTTGMTDRLLSKENVLLVWLVYPFVKTVHELGHAYTVKMRGGEVHEMGLMLLVFTPTPYVDASSSLAFRDRRSRILVSAAGIIVELIIASVAMIVWASVAPGAVRSVAYNIMLICGASTLLFNGNPLLRYDGYYILSDLIGIPNLGSRSDGFVRYLAEKYLLGIESRTTAKTPDERPWLLAYSISSYAYRVVLAVKIALFVAGRYFFFGVILALWSLSSLIVMPLYAAVRFLSSDGRLSRKRVRVAAVVALVLTALTLVLLVIPMPFFTVTEGVIWVPEESQVFASADGIVSRIVATPGSRVRKGDLLVVLDDHELPTKVRVIESQLKVFQAQLREQMVKDRIRMKMIHDDIARTEHELAVAREHLRQLKIYSPADGVFLLPQASDVLGRFVKRGSPMAYVAEFDELLVRIVVSQSDVDMVRRMVSGVDVRLSESLDRSFHATVKREVPGATHELPSLALSTEGGGSIALDPRGAGDSRDGREMQKEGREQKARKEPRAVEKLFHFELSMEGLPLNKIGERVYVRFAHEPEPVGFRLYRTMRRLLLRKFDV